MFYNKNNKTVAVLEEVRNSKLVPTEVFALPGGSVGYLSATTIWYSALDGRIFGAGSENPVLEQWDVCPFGALRSVRLVVDGYGLSPVMPQSSRHITSWTSDPEGQARLPLRANSLEYVPDEFRYLNDVIFSQIVEYRRAIRLRAEGRMEQPEILPRTLFMSTESPKGNLESKLKPIVEVPKKETPQKPSSLMDGIYAMFAAAVNYLKRKKK